MPLIVTLLGYAGLIPFVCAALFVLLAEPSSWLFNALNLYSFGIFAFMCGSWWPTVDIQHTKWPRILLSNVFFLSAFFVYLFIPDQWLIFAAVLFVMLWLLESFSPLLFRFSKPYLLMRGILSTAASLSMLVVYFYGNYHG